MRTDSTSEQVERRAAYLRVKIERALKELADLGQPSLRPASGDFADVNVLIGVPAYGGALQHAFFVSLLSLSQTLFLQGIRHQIRFMSGHSLIPFVRDFFANLLFETDSNGQQYTHLLMLDADQGFEASDVMKMVKSRKEIVALPCCMKEFDWALVAEAAKRGAQPDQLAHFAGKPNFADLEPRTVCSVTSELVEVSRVGTAIMLIDRSVFERLAQAHPEWKYTRNPHQKQNPSGRPDYSFFQLGLDRETGMMLSEDFFFCAEARKLGMRIWIVPSAVTTHVGSFDFLMNMSAVGSVRTGEKQLGH